VDAEARCEALEAQLALAREDNARLRALLGVEFLAPVDWQLTPYETRLLGVTLAREVATKAQLYEAVCAGRVSDLDCPEPKIVDVYICKLRKKLDVLGVAIGTRWGVGYFMAPADKARLRELIADSNAGARACA
jgi:two-component system cell cycle response regulator CtrA